MALFVSWAFLRVGHLVSFLGADDVGLVYPGKGESKTNLAECWTERGKEGENKRDKSRTDSQNTRKNDIRNDKKPAKEVHNTTKKYSEAQTRLRALRRPATPARASCWPGARPVWGK